MPKVNVPILGEIEPGSSEAARQRALYEKEKGFDTNISESVVGQSAKAEREARALWALGIKQPEKKDQGKKTAEKNLLENVWGQIKDLKASLAAQGITEYSPLTEFEKKLESWIDLKESDLDLIDEFPEIEKSGRELVDEVKNIRKRKR